MVDPATDETLEVTTYGYNAMGKLAEAEVDTYSSGVIAAREIEDYAYDYSGNRVGVTHSTDADGDGVPETVTHRTMLVDTQNFTGSPQVIEETLFDNAQPPNITERQAYLIGRDITAQTTTQYAGGLPQTSQTLYLLKDGQNSTRLVTDSAVQIVERDDYDAFGVLLSDSSTSTNILYRGEPLDSLTGDYNLDARMYDPGIGRFNSLDPFPASLNKYAYCHDDPVNFSDPTGMFEGLVSLAVTMSLGSSIDAGYSIHVGYTGLSIITDILYAQSTMNGIWGQQKEHSTATFITHGVGMHFPGWSHEPGKDIQQAYIDGGLTTCDFLEYTWSGFELNYYAIPAARTHNLAVAFQVLAMDVAMAKGYDNIDMIAHSWGTCITYDAIEQSGLAIKNWVTMGSPLRAETGKPGNVGRWIDIYSNYDPVTWLNCFPPFPDIETDSWDGFVLSLIPLAGAVNAGYSSERVYADVLRDATGKMDLHSPGNIIGGIADEHLAYWLNTWVVDQFVPFLV